MLTLTADVLRQVLTVGTVMLFVGSLSTVAVPKLAGQLVDVCIQVSKGIGPVDAKHQLNSAPQAMTGYIMHFKAAAFAILLQPGYCLSTYG